MDTHPTLTDLEAHLTAIAAAPADEGVLEMIVRRPDVDQREVRTELQGSRSRGRRRRHVPVTPTPH